MLLLQGSILDYQLKMTDRKLDHLVWKIKSGLVYLLALLILIPVIFEF
jgi:hypothetical protein